MMEKNSFEELARQKEEWEGYGRKLSAILADIAEKIGDAPIYVDESGDFGVHPEVLRILHEPGNEGPLEFLLYMQRTGIASVE